MSYHALAGHEAMAYDYGRQAARLFAKHIAANGKTAALAGKRLTSNFHIFMYLSCTIVHMIT